MESSSFLAPLLFAVAGLLFGAILKSVLKSTNFPYTVGLFALGLLTGILNRCELFEFIPALQETINAVANTEPDFILYVFLPILIFDAAYEMDMHIFKKTLSNATLLAGPGLIVAMLLTGVMMILISIWIPGYESWTWAFALMFGGLISATDPVAVVALLKELGVSKRFSTLVDAESLLNDGTGIVCFMLFFGTYTLAGQGETSPFLEFFQVVAGGAILGYVLARGAIWFITRVNSEEMIQNSVIILSAYLTFFLSQYYLGVSGVIALVAFGLTIGSVGKPRLKPQVNTFMEKFWELLTHMANTLIFIIVGVVIAEKVSFTWTSIGVLFLIYLGLNLIRFIMVMLFYPFMKRMGYGLSKRDSVILSWGGLRGALGMTLALMVSYTPSIPEDIREQILFFTAGIVTLTLAINATTTRWLLNKLGLTRIPSARTMMDRNIQEHIRDNAEKYYDRMQKREPLNGANWEKVRKYLPLLDTDTDNITPPTKDLQADIRLRVLDKEKSFCWNIYSEGIISQNTFQKLMISLDELYDHEGRSPLSNRKSIFNFYEKAFIINSFNLTVLHEWISLYFREKIAIAYDLGRGFIIIQKESLKMIEELRASGMFSEEQQLDLKVLCQEVKANINIMDAYIERISKEHPKAYNHALTQKAIRMLLSNERRVINQMQSEGVLLEADAQPLIEKLDERADSVNSWSHTLLGLIFKSKKAKKIT